MRKILFWILIIVLLFLVVVLGVAYYKNKTPLNVLRGWFGVENTIQVESTLSNNAEEEKKIDVTEKIKETVTQEGTTTTTSSNNTLTEEDKKAVKSLVDGLIVK